MSQPGRPPPGLGPGPAGVRGDGLESGLRVRAGVPGLGLGQEVGFAGPGRPAEVLPAPLRPQENEGQPPALAAQTQLLASASPRYCFAAVSRQQGRARAPPPSAAHALGQGWAVASVGLGGNARAQSDFAPTPTFTTNSLELLELSLIYKRAF